MRARLRSSRPLTTALLVLASLAIAPPAALATTVTPASVGETNTVAHCKSYAYVCTPGYTGDNAAGGWAWTRYGGSYATTPTGTHNCTLYAAWRLQKNGLSDPGKWGNAVDWAANIGGGNHTPTLGSIAWWGSERGGGRGHVGYVDQIQGSMVRVIADNYSSTMGYTAYDWMAASSVDLFLHPHDLSTSSDVNADGRDDLILRNGATFSFDTAHNGGTPDNSYHFGVASDQVYIGDVDGDGRSDVIARRGNVFAFDTAHDGGIQDSTYRFGNASDQVYIGDVNADGRDDIILRRGNVFYFDTAHNGGNADSSYTFGLASDDVYIGDFNGGGRDDLILRRGNVFSFDTAHNGGMPDTSYTFGLASDQVYIGDVDANGRDDLILRRGNVFSFDTAHNGGMPDTSYTFGLASDQVYIGDVNGDGRDDLILRRGTTFSFDTAHNGGSADRSYTFGAASDTVEP